MLEYRDFSCARGGVVIFSNLNKTIESGSKVVVSGPNGVGKTSLLRMTGGFIKPSSGILLYEKEEVRYGKSDFGFCFYSGNSSLCNGSMTVLENLTFWANSFSTVEMLNPIMEYLSLMPFRDMRYDYLSSGWKKRVSIAVLPLSDADVWLMDEPFTYLDNEASVLVSEMIMAKTDGGGIVIVASHDKSYIDSNYSIIDMSEYTSAAN